MWIFEARYIRIKDDKIITRPIVFDGNGLEGIKDCFLFAMGKAYDLECNGELLVSIEFIGG